MPSGRPFRVSFRHRAARWCVPAALLLLAAPALAADAGDLAGDDTDEPGLALAAADDMDEPGLWTFGAGGSGYRHARAAAHVVVAYRHRPVVGIARPSFGLLSSSAGSLFVFGGLSADVELKAGWGLSPLLTVGYYERGADMNLGGALEFRSGLEVFRRLNRNTRLGVGVHHISNAGLFDRNPGRETLFLTWGFGR